MFNNAQDEEMHKVPICFMSDVESAFKLKLKNMLRDPLLSHHEAMDKIKPYMGNPFTAPGTLGLKYIQNLQAKSLPKFDQQPSENAAKRSADKD